MTKLQWAVIASAVILFVVAYFVFGVKPRNVTALERSRALVAERISVSTLLRESKEELSREGSQAVLALESQLGQAPNDDTRVELLKRLSGKWFELGVPALAGHYAQLVAEQTGAEEAWSIAGTTYTICIQRSAVADIRSFCTARAVAALENAISLNPSNMAHQVNLALAYAANPPEENPMKGILLLRDLNQSNPDNVLILNALARLAIQTGQYERAEERLEAAFRLEPDNPTTVCLLAQAYEGAGKAAQAAEFAAKCRAFSSAQ
jgi:cytochrome c-type biogenesis protein CcmH/NrfG